MAGNTTSKVTSWRRPPSPPIATSRKRFVIRLILVEKSRGIVFTYIGTRQKMPLFPAYEWVSLPDDRMHVVKSYLECNYLQGIEGDFDSSHTTFLHCNNLAVLPGSIATVPLLLRQRKPSTA